jgi:hypothetical protein
MSAHRFREHLENSTENSASPFTGVGVTCAFVPCPVLAGFSSVQQAQIQEIYRIAAERTRDQLRRSWAKRPQFSLN